MCICVNIVTYIEASCTVLGWNETFLHLLLKMLFHLNTARILFVFDTLEICFLQYSTPF